MPAIQAMTAMMWKALIHAYMPVFSAVSPLALPRPGPHPRDQLLHMRNGCFGQDAVTEVEDKRTIREGLQDRVDLTVERGAARHHYHRIEIALDAAPCG